MRNLSEAKWSYTTRGLADPRSVPRSGVPRSAIPRTGTLRIGPTLRVPRAGDFVVAEVIRLGAHERLEGPQGRRMRLFPGDMLVGAYGSRYATDYFEGHLPGEGDEIHLLTSGGLIGTVASAHARRGEPTQLRVLGPLVDADGHPVTTDDVALDTPPTGTPPAGTIVVLGSAMSAGKTTTTSALARGLSRSGLRVGAGKVTGSGSGKDHWSYVDAGAAVTADFLDFGMPSTFGYPIERIGETLTAIRDSLVEQGADVVLLEIADGVLQKETRWLSERLPGFADRVVLAAADALAGVAGVELLRASGVRVDLVSGVVTASPLAVDELVRVVGIPVRGPDELARGGALELLGHRGAPDADDRSAAGPDPVPSGRW